MYRILHTYCRIGNDRELEEYLYFQLKENGLEVIQIISIVPAEDDEMCVHVTALFKETTKINEL